MNAIVDGILRKDSNSRLPCIFPARIIKDYHAVRIAEFHNVFPVVIRISFRMWFKILLEAKYIRLLFFYKIEHFLTVRYPRLICFQLFVEPRNVPGKDW